MPSLVQHFCRRTLKNIRLTDDGRKVMAAARMRGPMLQMKYILTTRYDNVTLSPEQKRTERGLRYRIYLTTGTRQNNNINSIKIMIRKNLTIDFMELILIQCLVPVILTLSWLPNTKVKLIYFLNI